MANIINGHLKSPFQKFSVETVRALLETDNKGIAKLCAQVSLMPQKDDLGRTYFTKDDLEILRRVKAMNKEVNEVKTATKSTQKAYATVPVKSSAPAAKKTAEVTKTVQNSSFEQRSQSLKEYPAQQNFSEDLGVKKTFNFPVKKDSSAAIEKICSSMSEMQDNLTEKIADLIEQKLEEKLDGIDEVVVELVRCKTENETLRYKMNELNKEVYNLKNELSRYKSIGMGFYIKKNGESSLI